MRRSGVHGLNPRPSSAFIGLGVARTVDRAIIRRSGVPIAVVTQGASVRWGRGEGTKGMTSTLTLRVVQREGEAPAEPSNQLARHPLRRPAGRLTIP